MILVKLFWAFLKVGSLSIGGAYSFLPVIQREIVAGYGWLERKEFLDVLGAVQIFPGAISIKYATYTGYKVAGIWGAVVANLGNLLPPAAFIGIAGYFYARYRGLPRVENALGMIRIAVISMILAVAFKMINWPSLLSWWGILVAIGGFALFFFLRVHPAVVIVLAALVGVLMRR